MATYPRGIRCKSPAEFVVTGESGAKSFVCGFHRDRAVDRAFTRQLPILVRPMNREEREALEATA